MTVNDLCETKVNRQSNSVIKQKFVLNQLSQKL